MWLRFTEVARKLVIAAQDRAGVEQTEEVEPRHLLWAALGEESGLAEALSAFALTAAMVREALDRSLTGPLAGPDEERRDKHFSERAKEVLQGAYNVARELNHPYVGSWHVVVGVLSVGDPGVAQVLGAVGLDVADLRQAVYEGRWPAAADEPPAAGEAIPPQAHAEPPVSARPSFTAEARRAILAAHAYAAEEGVDLLEPRHLLRALAYAGKILTKAGMTPQAVDAALRAHALSDPPGDSGGEVGWLSDHARTAMQAAETVAKTRDHAAVDLCHLAAGLLRCDDAAVNYVLQLLNVARATALAQVLGDAPPA